MLPRIDFHSYQNDSFSRERLDREKNSKLCGNKTRYNFNPIASQHEEEGSSQKKQRS